MHTVSTHPFCVLTLVIQTHVSYREKGTLIIPSDRQLRLLHRTVPQANAHSLCDITACVQPERGREICLVQECFSRAWTRGEAGHGEWVACAVWQSNHRTGPIGTKKASSNEVQWTCVNCSSPTSSALQVPIALQRTPSLLGGAGPSKRGRCYLPGSPNTPINCPDFHTPSQPAATNGPEDKAPWLFRQP